MKSEKHERKEVIYHVCHASRYARLRRAALGDRGPAITVPHNFFQPIRSFTSAPYGQSDHAQCLHYSGQARLASERRLKATYFNREDLMKHIESKQVLSVE
jgi:hypothetical protein